MSLSQDNLVFVYKLISSEENILNEINNLDNRIRELSDDKNFVEATYMKRNNTLKIIIGSIIISLMIMFILKFSFVISFIILLVAGFIYEKKKKEGLIQLTNELDTEINYINQEKNLVQGKLQKLMTENATYTNQLPELFRDSSSIAQLYDLFQTGQVDTLKEAYNLLEARYRHAEQMNIMTGQYNILSENNALLRQQLHEARVNNELERQQLNALYNLNIEAQQINSNISDTTSRVKNVEQVIVPEHKIK